MENYSLNAGKGADTPSGLVQLQLDTGAQAMKLCIVLRCQFPDGFMVSGSANIPGCHPPVYLPPTQVRGTAGTREFVMHTCGEAPAGYSSLMVAHWHANGQKPVAGMKLAIELIQRIGPENPLYDDPRALTVAEFKLPPDAFLSPARALPYLGIRIGYKEQTFNASADSKP